MCPKLPLPCPNKCEVGSVPREDMKKHRAKCQLEIVSCSNYCGEKLERQFLANHIHTNANVHVVSLTASTAMIQENISSLRANTRRCVPSFPYSVPTNVKLEVFHVRISQEKFHFHINVYCCDFVKSQYKCFPNIGIMNISLTLKITTGRKFRNHSGKLHVTDFPCWLTLCKVHKYFPEWDIS